MKRFKLLAVSMIALFTAAMAGCGGGGNGGTPPGVTGAAVSKGVMTKGSVIVNGITFTSTASTKIFIDGVEKPETELKDGMVVKVTGSSDDATKLGTPTKIEAEDALQGTVSNPINNTITVMGQTVRIEDNVTRLFDDTTLKTFADAQAAGRFSGEVEVHGFPDDQGGLRATRIVQKLGENEFEIKGFVKSIDTVTGTFVLSLTPGGAAALTVTGSLPAGAGVNSIVEVKATGVPVGGAITAAVNGVKLEDALGAENEKVEVEGIITSGDLSNSIVVNGQQVSISSATIFVGGLRSDLALGIKVEAEGPLVGGVIQATKISFRSNIKIEADVTNFTSGVSITLLTKTVKIDPLFTRIDGAIGTRAEVRAFLNNAGELVATRIVPKGPDSNQRAFLQGPVSNVNISLGTFNIIGIAINTDVTGVNTKFEIDNDSSSEVTVAPATFFGKLVNNVTVVKVRWRPFVSTSAVVEQAEIEEGNH